MAKQVCRGAAHLRRSTHGRSELRATLGSMTRNLRSVKAVSEGQSTKRPQWRSGSRTFRAAIQTRA